MEIKVRITQQQIWGDTDIEDEGYDQYESEVSLIEIIESYTKEEYPNATIDILTALIENVTVDGDDEYAGNENANIAAHVWQLIDKAWNENWEVIAY